MLKGISPDISDIIENEKATENKESDGLPALIYLAISESVGDEALFILKDILPFIPSDEQNELKKIIRTSKLKKELLKNEPHSFKPCGSLDPEEKLLALLLFLSRQTENPKERETIKNFIGKFKTASSFFKFLNDKDINCLLSALDIPFPNVGNISEILNSLHLTP